jgi:flagellar biogenesis protein FliO
MKSDRLQIAIVTALLALPGSAFASVNLKAVQVSGGSQVDFLFDGKISRSQIKTEFFGDTIQLSLSDAAVYPAKISSVSGGELTKIFAYQYAPKLVRCRLSMKGKAEEFRSRLVLEQKGKILSVRFGSGESDQIASHAAQAVRAQPVPGPGEHALLENILNQPKAADPAPAAPQPEKIEPAKAEPIKPAPVAMKAQPVQGPPTEALATGKPLISPIKMMAKLFGVLALFGLFALAMKKFLEKGANLKKGGALSRLIQRGMSRYGKTARMIEVVSTHHLGPKKSIAVVRIGGRNLVLGISQENINLITQLDAAMDEDLGEEGQADGILESLGVRGAAPAAGPNAASGATRFDSILSGEASRPRAPSTAADPVLEPPSVRARIRSRLEGMKPL